MPRKDEEAPLDYGKITSLKDFPALVKMGDVCKLFGVSETNCFKKYTFEALKTQFQNGDAKIIVAFPDAIQRDGDTETVLFKRSAIQKYLRIDQYEEDGKP